MARLLPLIAALVLSPAASGLAAQRLETWPRFEPAAPFAPAPDRVKVGNYALEGLAIGAVAVGVASLLVVGDSCGSGAPGTTCSSNKGDSFLLGAGIGAFVGLLVGGVIPKYGPAPAP